MTLRLDWCSIDAARYAVEHWHYSRKVPRQKLVKIGVWESSRFVGCVLFGDGANNNVFAPYGLDYTQGCELVRIALHVHKTPVSRIISLAIMLLRKACPKIRLIVSFADTKQGHHGGIYQASNWVYAGQTVAADEYVINGRQMHGRAIRKTLSRWNIPGDNTLERARVFYRDPLAFKVQGSVKHRYLLPLDDEIRARIAPLAQPYPKRAKQATSADPAPGGGAAPTRTLQILAIA